VSKNRYKTRGNTLMHVNNLRNVFKVKTAVIL